MDRAFDAEEVFTPTQQPVLRTINLRTINSLKHIVPRHGLLCQVPIIPVCVSDDTASRERNIEVKPTVGVRGH